MKVQLCPTCKSNAVRLYMPQFNLYRCDACGYIGGLILEEDITQDIG